MKHTRCPRHRAAALDVEGGSAAEGTGWQLVRERGARHAGRLPQRLHQPLLFGTRGHRAAPHRTPSRRGRVRSNVTRPSGSKPNGTRPRLRKWTTRIADVVEEREGEGDFGHDERLRQASRRRGGRRAHAFGEHRVRRRADRLPERGQAGEHAGGDRHRHAEAEHLPVDRDVIDARDECGRGGQDVPDEDRAQTDAGGGAGDRHERALGEVAQRELAPRRAERDADRRLAGADDGSRQQQRGDVGAGDEQQEAGAAEQDQQRGADAAPTSDRRFAQVGHVRRVEPIPLRIGRGDGGGDAPDVRPRLFQRDPRFAAGVREVLPAAPVRVGRRRIERNPHLGVAACHRPGSRAAAGTPAA